MDWELLEAHHEGIIATTGCLGGHVLQRLLNGDEQGALDAAARLQDIFGKDNLFVEVQDHGLLEQTSTNPKLVEIARADQCPAARHERQPLHAARATPWPTTRCCASRPTPRSTRPIGSSSRRPALPEVGGRNALAVLRDPRVVRQHAVGRGAGQRRDRLRSTTAPELPGARGPDRGGLPPPAHVQGGGPALRRGPRTACPRSHQYELEVIESMGFSAYFLVVWDLVHYARSQGIRVGPGRGARRGRVSRTACASSTSTRSGTTCSSNGS